MSDQEYFDPQDPYGRILKVEINDRNGYFDAKGYAKELYDWCVKHFPITKNIYKRLTPEQQRKFRGKFRAWGMRGGLWLAQRGVAWRHFGDVDDRYTREAKLKAAKDRFDNHWTDPDQPKDDPSFQEDLDYLIDPSGSDGRDKGNGQPYGPYTRPGMENDVVLPAGMRFTI